MALVVAFLGAPSLAPSVVLPHPDYVFVSANSEGNVSSSSKITTTHERTLISSDMYTRGLLVFSKTRAFFQVWFLLGLFSSFFLVVSLPHL